MSDKIFEMLDLFYANKHLYEKIKKKKKNLDKQFIMIYNNYRNKEREENMEYLHYNFDKVARIPKSLYDKVWACKNLWDDENADLLEDLCDEVGEDIFEINCTPQD